ncbi:MAG: glutamate formiminotransferase/formiminotetrahydrofolate cyclodeaminase [Sphingobacteriales bacterium]|jgi:glutamate formiminotransferase/formiminotetrahydrofolate cyclodeaminase
MKQIIECVPNFSEGRDLNVIKQITNEIETVDGVKLLDVDPGKATNRTVVTFVGEPEAAIEAAFLAIKKASELIDMSKHSGEHPRMGATDVCPLIPVANISMEEVAEYAHKLGKRVGRELNIPGYFYESAATKPERKNLATVRAGEYEGMEKKVQDPNWKPDFGPAKFNAKTGVTGISARDFLIAYNVNLNTTSTRRANSIAFDIRENGRVKRTGDPVTGEIVTDEKGNPVRIPGTLKGVKAIGWYIEEYGVCQISMNITDFKATPFHVAYEETFNKSLERGLRVTGSELVGLVPKSAMIEAGKYFLKKQERSVGVSEEELIKIAIRSMGLDELAPFDPKKKIIEYMLDEESSNLVDMTVKAFADETASESPAPGGGSIAAYAGVLGASLGTMVANLSSHKRGWDDKWEFYSDWAEKGQDLKDQLLFLVDEDTQAFNKIMEAFRLPNSDDAEKAERSEAIQEATKYAIEIPFKVMEVSFNTFDMLEAMAKDGLKASISDAGVGALCILTAIKGAFLNVKINLGGLKDQTFKTQILEKGNKMVAEAQKREAKILEIVEAKIG